MCFLRQDLTCRILFLLVIILPILVFEITVKNPQRFSLITAGYVLCIFTSCIFYTISIWPLKTLFVMSLFFGVFFSAPALFDSNINVALSIVDNNKKYQWSMVWPDQSTRLVYQVYWPKDQRAWPAELRIVSHLCMPTYPLKVQILNIQDDSVYTVDLDKSGVWKFPISNGMFTLYDTLSISLIPVIPNNTCSIIFSRWKKSASQALGNVYIISDGELHTGSTNSIVLYSLKGNLLAQLWDPKY